ncbi:VPS10 domain-containing receptor [Triplophysa tibetana]|uniref:VPS10 domain-containing receptor n=1 Tax=Triplophysa tibetana TaxID=1572043 RepID=A0A5A9PMD2_9TELE|nr:VPS10 domain-containing receptor [Triplophysa tibetana]
MPHCGRARTSFQTKFEPDDASPFTRIYNGRRKRVILVGSSINERDQMFFISTDEGSSFQRQPVSFSVETLLFHPSEEDKLLAYSKETQLYVSTDLGHKWTLLQERVTKDRVFWAMTKVDVDPDLVHMEIQDIGGGYLYVTCLIQNCSDKMVTAQFLGKIDHNSLSVQDDYIFVKVTTGNRTKHYVSYRRNDFVQMRFPKYALPKDVQIVSTDENQVFLALQEWYQTDTYNLYQSDTQGVYYSIVLENVRSTKQPEENVLIDILEVRGVKGVFLANQKIDGKVATLITYNKGRDWERLAPPTTDMNGKPVNCKQPDCHLHLHLRWADNPYVSGTVHTKDSAPGLIMGAGNLGSQLVEYKEEMYITADCGKTWRQVFEEEHHILYLDHGGVIVAIKDTSIPLKILKFSIDEGRTWSVHNFTSTSVFVDGLLSEPGDETLVMTVFGHISYRSDWELVKVDFRQSFPRQCTEADYDSWKLTDLQGEKCIMGQERMYRRRKESSFCIKGKSYTSALMAKPCQCTEKDFAWYKNTDNLWQILRVTAVILTSGMILTAPPENCHFGHSYKSSTGYRKVIANVCEGGMNKEESSKQHSCPLLPPRGLQLGIKGQMLAVAPGDDITFIVHQEQGDTTSTRYQVDLMDGVRAIYENLTLLKGYLITRFSQKGEVLVTVQASNDRFQIGKTMIATEIASSTQGVYIVSNPITKRMHESNLSCTVLFRGGKKRHFYNWAVESIDNVVRLQDILLRIKTKTYITTCHCQMSNGVTIVQKSFKYCTVSQFQRVTHFFARKLSKGTANTVGFKNSPGQGWPMLFVAGNSVPFRSVCATHFTAGPAGASRGRVLYGLDAANKIKERSVAISLNSVRRQRSLIRAQGLTDDPALHTWMKTIVCEDLRRQKQSTNGRRVGVKRVCHCQGLNAQSSFLLRKLLSILRELNNQSDIHAEVERDLIRTVLSKELTVHIVAARLRGLMAEMRRRWLGRRRCVSPPA